MLGKEVKPDRFLWHVTWGHTSSDLSIAQIGLRKPKDYAVFAHNQLTDFNDMYPYFMDCWDFDNRLVRTEYSPFYNYSFWRIDTKIAKVPWYIDPYCASEPFIDQPLHYLCTPNPIPKEALKLFKFDLKCYVERTPYIHYSNGAAHISPIFSDFDTLKPNPIYEKMARKLAKIRQFDNSSS